ncbi:hypothetical protein [Herbaspirillum sp.]|uniref:hypothetical protein n=1 Tax=Herbaspirillum sp. TaxID=1890675 RepID=UPI001B132921|nr:hypothetical protein [Herbaspirillum sp.]MBO9538666.1 hypothetical protein [Herbaspirillum sp.]
MQEDAFVLGDTAAVGRICAHSLRYDGMFSKDRARKMASIPHAPHCLAERALPPMPE